MKDNDVSDVGQGMTHSEAVEKYDAEAGKYADNVSPTTPADDRLTTAAMPKAADPSPFTLGPMSPGGRE